MATRINYIIRALFILLAVVLFAPAMAQNTKGDRPMDNQRTIRRTEGKSVKKRSKASTRDIAGRRLRTKNKSSANRANVGIPQPPTTSRRPRRHDDRAVRVPINKQYSSREARRSDPDRAWQGDVSGFKSRKIKPSQSDANRANVYPQRKYATRQPHKQPPFKGYQSKTASGKPIVKRSPQRSERAWKGDIRGDIFVPPTSRTGQIKNVHPQKTRYSKYVSKRPSPTDRSYSNREKLARARSLGSPGAPKSWRLGAPGAFGSGQKPFVTRGRKNVYWGKLKHRERATTRDLAGRPLARRNFRSGGMGLIGRDTLQFFGRKPHDDAQMKKRRGSFLPGSEAKGGWQNDIAGYRLRKHAPGGGVAGKKSLWDRFSGKGNNLPIQGRAPGIGASAVERGLRRTGGAPGNNMQDQGGAFTGFLKSRRPGKSVAQRGAFWNNNGSPIGGKGISSNGLRAGTFQGRSRGGKIFEDQGYGYSGFLKQQKKGSYVGGSHVFWNNKGRAVTQIESTKAGARAGTFQGRSRGGKNFADQGSGYTGDIKRRDRINDQGSGYTGFLKQQKKGSYVGTRHTLWNNRGKAITEIGATKAGASAGLYQGGLKAQRKGEYVGTRHTLWNNKGKAVTEIEATKAGASAGLYQGGLKVQKKGEYVGARHTLWNNKGKAVTELEATRAGALAGNFQGRSKTRGQKPKAVLTPARLWNNHEKAVTEIETTKGGAAAGLYQGRMKANKPVSYPLNSNRKSWNNNEKATTQVKLTNAGAMAGNFSGKTKFKKESRDRDTEIEDRMKLKKDYVHNPHSVEEALKKEKPHLNYKAGNFASGAKVTGRRLHNPHSVDDALDSYHNKASARRTDYQGNVKMKKFFDRRGESPDAKFVHQGENNVKEDRTIVTNVKLFWSRVFKKSESQPSNLKERSNKLRYDKGEKGLWAD